MNEDPRRLPGDDETLDDLAAGLRVLQRRRGHRSATDDLLAASCAAGAGPGASSVLDLGCGHGTVTLLLSGMLPMARFTSVEVQELSHGLLCRNVLINDLGQRVTPLLSDLRTLQLPERFDLVTGTPPFMPLGSGILPKDPQRAAGRFELRGGIEDYLEAAARHLAPAGRVSMLMDAAQDDRCRRAFDAAGLHLHQVRVFDPRPGRVPRYRGYIGGLEPREGPVLEERLLVRDEEGAYTPDMLALRREVGVPT